MTENTTNGKTIPEIVQETGKQVSDRAKTWLKDSNTRHVILKDRNGKKLFELNMTLALAGVLIASMVAFWAVIIGAVAGYFLKLQIEVTREVNSGEPIDIIEG